MKIVGLDFETTGLSPYAGDKAELMGFTEFDGTKRHLWLNDKSSVNWMRKWLANEDWVYAAHNAKFELSFLREKFDIEIKGIVWDTEVMARVENNNHRGYSLQKCAERMGDTKHPPMLEWLKRKGNKGQHLQAPHDMLIPYVEKDAWLSWKLCHNQIETFKEWDKGPFPIKPVVDLECKVLRPLFDMESKGLLVDLGYVKQAIEYEKEKIAAAKAQYRLLASSEFVASAKTLQPVFDSHGISYGRTELGNASFSEESIKGSKDHPVVGAIVAIRHHEKRLSSYWEKFLELHVGGVIHPSIHQNQAKTGRMSISDPSCQNWPRDDDDQEDDDFPVRRAFLARPGCQIASLDYAQMELRRISDEAQDHVMIQKINSGADLHQDTAHMAGVSRSLAKNGRFCRQYEGGYKRVADTLGVDMTLARKICDAIDGMAEATTTYRRGLIKFAEKTKMGFNFLGRRYYFDRGFEYTYPNYRIQGACAEILKRAIVQVDAFLKAEAHPDTYMILPVHDEICINTHESDLHLLPQVKQLMIAANTDVKTLGMDVTVHVGPNMHDMERLAL